MTCPRSQLGSDSPADNSSVPALPLAPPYHLMLPTAGDRPATEIYSHITQPLTTSEVMPFAARWMDLEIMTLSEVSQT